MSVFDATFGTKDVIAAAGVTNDALQTWIRRGLIVGQDAKGVDMPGKQGVRRAFTFFNVVEIAVAAALIDGGLDLRQAFRAAANFAHCGDGQDLPGSPARVPAMPFREGRTYLAVAGDESVELKHAPGKDDLIDMARHRLSRPRCITFLNASEVVEDVLQRLGRDAKGEIAAAYADSAAMA